LENNFVEIEIRKKGKFEKEAAVRTRQRTGSPKIFKNSSFERGGTVISFDKENSTVNCHKRNARKFPVMKKAGKNNRNIRGALIAVKGYMTLLFLAEKK
jgi:hypothetical protein